MLAKDVIKLLDAGYSKEEIEKMESAENVTNEEPTQEETNEEPTQEETNEEPGKDNETDPLSAYKEQLAEINKELAEATKEMQKYNLAMRRQPEAPTEDASDILYNATINTPPESN